MPSNINPLSPNGYQFSIERLPSLSYFCQEVNLPDVSLGIASAANPYLEYAIPGDRLTFGDITVQFLIDSEMANYKAIFDWMQGLGFPENNAQYTAQVKTDMSLGELPATMSDATLTILGNNNRPIRSVKFIDCIPMQISSLTFTSTSQDVQYLIGNVTFKYSYYKFEN